MNRDHLQVDADPGGSGTVSAGDAANPRHAPCYMQAAPLVDVLREQVDYLMFHADIPCSPGCPDCARLSEVIRCLLKPFGSMPELQR